MPRIALALALALAVAVAPAALAGDLTPPGAPAPTMKTLDQVEPRIPIGPLTTPGDATSVYRITQSGSYYLTGNVVGAANKSGIMIAASEVTVDLMGFAVIGATDSVVGVNASGGERITVRNGVVRGWGLSGINLLALYSAVIDCNASYNVNQGIIVGPASEVASCRVVGNGSHGVQVNTFSLVRNVVSLENNGNGVQLAANCVIRDSVLENNLGRGVMGGDGLIIIGCIASTNGFSGFQTTGGATISQCTALSNVGVGFNIGRSTTISECTAFGNHGDGIVGGNDNRISRNVCVGSGTGPSDGAGIHVTGSDNTIVDNAVTDSDRGVDVDVAGNFIARNTASGNTINFDVAAGNVCFVIAATTSAAISGSSGGVSPGSTDPNANYTY